MRILLCRNHLFRKLKEGRYRIAMGPRALTASSGLVPWSMAVDRLGNVKEKSDRSRVKSMPRAAPLWER